MAFDANVGGGHAIFTGDGVSTKKIVDSVDQGLIGRFLGAPSINNAGTVAFLGLATDSVRKLSSRAMGDRLQRFWIP